MVFLPLLEADAVTVDTGTRAVNIAGIRTADGRLLINRLEDGKLNLQALSEFSSEEDVGPDVEAPAAAAPSAPWAVSLGTLDLTNYQVRAENLVPENKAGAIIDTIRVGAKDFSTRQESTGTVDMSCRINESGELTVKGVVGISPVSARLTAGLEHLGLTGLYPFLAAYFPGAITGGEVSVMGDIVLAQTADGALNANFDGQAGINDFKAVDKQNGRPLIAFNALELTAIKAGNSPVALTIGDVQLKRLAADLDIDAEGNFNLYRTTGAEPRDAAGAPETKGEPLSINIGRFALTDGRLRFSDKMPAQPFHTELSDINFQVTGLSSRPDQMAVVLFSGLLDNQASLNLSGRISPLAEKPYADIVLKIENMELSGLSSYSGKYIGRNIAKGKLFTDLGYTIKDQTLTAKNHVFIDQLALGTAVDSPKATNLPVGLAISLLRDRQGKITLDVPVSGNLNDPKFSLGRIILQAFTNIIAKAATSPFSLVSAALGGADPSHLAFDYGSSEIPEKDRPAIDSLVELLYNRPTLAIELSGFVDSEQDGRALSEGLFVRKLKALKQAELDASARTTPVDSITLTPEEYEDYLWQAYKLETFSKPKNALGLDKKLPLEELQALMRQHIQADGTQLKMLADQRARQVRDRILSSGKVEPERVFVVEAASLKPESVDGVGSSRVDVRLK
jgi:hypothetical protein